MTEYVRCKKCCKKIRELDESEIEYPFIQWNYNEVCDSCIEKFLRDGI